MSSGTPYFREKVRNSLNSLSNGDSLEDYKPDTSLFLEYNNVLDRAKYTLEEGILKKYRVLRERQLDRFAAEKCYENSELNYLEAEQCENFMKKNDFKLNAINKFFYQNTIRHVKSYHAC